MTVPSLQPGQTVQVGSLGSRPAHTPFAYLSLGTPVGSVTATSGTVTLETLTETSATISYSVEATDGSSTVALSGEVSSPAYCSGDPTWGYGD
jgi:hypothetical protein